MAGQIGGHVMLTVEIRWRRPGEPSHFFLQRASQGGGAGGSVSLDLVDVSGADAAGWADPSVGLSCLVVSADDTGVRFSVGDEVSQLRLTFEVAPQVKGKSCEALTLTQHLLVRDRKVLADQFQTPRYAVTVRNMGGDDPVAQKVPSRFATTMARSFFGAHPLVSISGGAGILVDTEFLDVTSLWWDLHFRLIRKNPQQPIEFSPWYLAPGCGARLDQLLVLVNTRATPMIWFAAVPTVAGDALPDGTAVGGYLFFRPRGESPVVYSSSQASGLAEPALATTAMQTLSRYLLRGRTHAEKPFVSMLPDWSHLLGYVEHRDQPLSEYNALPCGMEDALERSSRELLEKTQSLRVLLLPLFSDSEGYGSIPRVGLPDRVDAAVRLLWCRDALGGHGQQLVAASGLTPPQPPQPGLAPAPTGALRVADDCWLGGYSQSGDTLWHALQVPATRARTGRVIAFDPVGLSSAGSPVLQACVRERARLGLRTFIIWSPYTIGAPPTQLAAQLAQMGGSVTVLPQTGWDYFRMPPNPKAPWVEYIFADNAPWSGGLQPTEKVGAWWHQIIAFGGEILRTDPTDPSSISFMQATMRP